MSAKKRRENTFRIDYGNVPKRPSSEEVHQFVGGTLGMKREEVLRIQYSRNLGVAFVKAACLEVAQKVVEENDNRHELMVDGKSFKLRLVMEDGAVEVKLFNLSEDVTNASIARFLMAYGELLSIREEVWDDKHLFAGLPTGVRVVRMIVRKNIPSFVTIDSETTQVAYYGQQQSCRHCSESVHNGVSCVQNKKLLVQKLAASSASYADVAKNSQSSRSAIGPKPLHTRPIVNKPAGQTNQEPSNAASASSLMPPPASAVQIAAETHDTINLAQTSDRKQEHEKDPWTQVSRRSKNGNESDASTSSRSSSKTKKARLNDSGNIHTVDSQL